MKYSYVEGLASHDGSESCVYTGNGVDEALTGVRVGQVLSREMRNLSREAWEVWGAEAVERCPRQHRCARIGESARDPTRSETLSTRASNSSGNREIPHSAAKRWEAWEAARIVKPTGVRR